MQLVDASHSACGPVGTPANFVVVNHGGGSRSAYVHMATVTVKIGDWVDASTQIGTVGAVGYTFPCPAYHLHFQVLGDQGGLEPGPLHACHGPSLVSYPSLLGYGAWDAVPPWLLGVWSDGSACALPGSPTAVTARARDAGADVSFSAPASDGGFPITSYAVTVSPGGAQWTGTSSSIAVGDLTNGTSYTFTVTATNSAGTGSASTPSSAVTPGSPPLCLVPNLRGRTLVRATAALDQANCARGKTTRKYSKTVKKGRVISQSPGPGTQLPNASTVNLVISRGRRP